MCCAYKCWSYAVAPTNTLDEITFVPGTDRSGVSFLLYFAVDMDRTTAQATKKTMQVSEDKSRGQESMLAILKSLPALQIQISTPQKTSKTRKSRKTSSNAC